MNYRLVSAAQGAASGSHRTPARNRNYTSFVLNVNRGVSVALCHGARLSRASHRDRASRHDDLEHVTDLVSARMPSRLLLEGFLRSVNQLPGGPARPTSGASYC